MLSFDDDEECEQGPQHSTPIKGKAVMKLQDTGSRSHPSKVGGGHGKADTIVNSQFVNPEGKKGSDHLNLQHFMPQHVNLSQQGHCDSTVDISKLSVIESTPHRRPVQHSPLKCICHLSQSHDSTSDTLQGDRSKAGFPASDSVNSESNLCIKQLQNSQQNPRGLDPRHSSAANDEMHRQNPGEQHPMQMASHGRHLQSEGALESDVSPRAKLRHRRPAEMVGGGEQLSPYSQKRCKSVCKMRPSSAPRCQLVHMNTCNNSNDFCFPSHSLSEFRKSPALYIEQDIISKQRQEIQLLMEELGTRDQELNDLVQSHQRQVKAWEGDCDKLAALKQRVTQYEDELRTREDQLKQTLAEMAQVNEQREVDARELERTKDEMVKLAERIMENSLYIQEMEEQNKKLSHSLKEYASARKNFTDREQELMSLLDEKDCQLTDRQQEIDKLMEHIKYLECRNDELEEKVTNVTAESTAWKKKYCLAQDEADRLTNECRTKEDNMQKMTQQLHESLQQAIALQKALFTSCEREKCKEEVMLSLRKQHKRTMQELSNIRELYDRLSRDKTLYHLSVKDGEERDEKLEGAAGDEAARKNMEWLKLKLDEAKDKERQDAKLKYDKNMSSHKNRLATTFEEGEMESPRFLVKEKKERVYSKAERAEEKTEDGRGRGDGGHTKAKELAQQISPPPAPRRTVKMMKHEQLSPISVRAGHITLCRNATTITSSTTLYSDDNSVPRPRSRCSSGVNPLRSGYMADRCHHTSLKYENVSKNADNRSVRSLSDSRPGSEMAKSMRTTTTSPIIVREIDAREEDKEPRHVCDSSSDVSHATSPPKFDEELTPADSDGMCHELKRDISRIGADCLNRGSSMPETGQLSQDSRNPKMQSNLTITPRKSSFLRKDKLEKKITFSADGEGTPPPRPCKPSGEGGEMQREQRRPPTMDGKSWSCERKFVGGEEKKYYYTSPEKESPAGDVKGSPGKRSSSGKKRYSPDYKGPKSHSVDGHSPSHRRKGHEKESPQRRSRYSAHDKESHRLERDHDGCRCKHEGHRPKLCEAHAKEERASKFKTGDLSQEECEQCQREAKRTCNCSKNAEPYSRESEEVGSKTESDSTKLMTASSHHEKSGTDDTEKMMEYPSSLGSVKSHHLHTLDGRVAIDNFQRWGSLSEIDPFASHQANLREMRSNPKVAFTTSQGGQYIHPLANFSVPKPETLPTDVAIYLARQRPLVSSLCVNNNRSTENQPDYDSGSEKQIVEENETLMPSHHHQLSPSVSGDEDHGTEDGLNSSRPERLSKVNHSFQSVSSDLKTHENAMSHQSTDPSKLNETSAASSVNLTSSHERCEKMRDVTRDTNTQQNILNTGGQNRCHINPVHSRTELDKQDANLNSDFVPEREIDTDPAPATVPAASKPFTSARGPSLYRHLTQIHFSEKTRRYEWVTPPDDNKDKMPGSRPSSRLSSSQERPNSRSSELDYSCSLTRAHDSSQEKSKSNLSGDLCQSRPNSQYSDSGLYSMGERPTGPVIHSGRSSDLIYQRPGQRSANMRHEKSKNINYNNDSNNNNSDYVITELEHNRGADNLMFDPELKQVSRDDENNVCFDISQAQNCNNGSVMAIHAQNAPLQVTLHSLDPVVRKLDFDDTGVSESRADPEAIEVVTHHRQNVDNSGDDLPVQDSVQFITETTMDENDLIGEEGAEDRLWPTEDHASQNKFNHVNGIMEYSDISASKCLKPSTNTKHSFDDAGSISCGCLDTDTAEQEEKFVAVECANADPDSNLPEYFNDISTILLEPEDEEGPEEMAEDELKEEVEKNLTDRQRKNTDKIVDCEKQSQDGQNSDSQKEEVDEKNVSLLNNISDIYMSKQLHQDYANSLHSVIKTEASDLFKYTTDVQHYCHGLSCNSFIPYECFNIMAQKQPDSPLDNTRDSNTSIPTKPSDVGRLKAPAWVYEDSVEEIADQFDEKLSSFLEDPQPEMKEESFRVTTPMSPATKLYRLLMESQEMVRCLERSSAVPEAIRSKISVTSKH